MTIKDGCARRVSIVVRTMGRPELGHAIASVLGQSWPDVEILMVVANPELSPRTEFAHPRIKIVKPGIPLLRPAAGNGGLEAATGEWIGFLDEDDIHEAHHAARMQYVVTDLESARIEDRPGNGPGGSMNPDLDLYTFEGPITGS